MRLEVKVKDKDSIGYIECIEGNKCLIVFNNKNVDWHFIRDIIPIRYVNNNIDFNVI